MIPLPIDALIPEVIEQLKQSSAVIVEAPPGSGKTTRIAPSLIDAGLCDSQRKAYLLQPRRVAAKATAQRIAAERGGQLGKEIGYQVRFESEVSAATALIVATEGVLLRRLASDPTIDDLGVVILDEFHERSLNADLILAMVRQVQQIVREDLRIVVMSATLDTAPLAKFLDAPVLKSSGTLYPVDIRYRPPKPKQKLAAHAAETVVLSAQRNGGDMLVFLPGVGEISQTENLLKNEPALRDSDVIPLHGSLPLEKQAKAIHAGERQRIILSTNVAETSLTIEGINTVIDSGQVRVLRFKPAAGLDYLQLEPVCQSSATQRAGRAGRLQAGVCIRLWDERSQRAKPEYLEPEIHRVDLSAAALQLYQCGERPDEFAWFEPPRKESVVAAVRLLEQLGALSNNQITTLGRRMAGLPVSPRLARMLIESESLGHADSISLVAAMLSERDPFLRQRSSPARGRPGGSLTRHASRWNCDVTQRLQALQRYFQSGVAQTAFGEVHRGAAHTIRKVAARFASMVRTDSTNGVDSSMNESDIISRAMLVAFPDRLARRRKSGDKKGRMVGGRGVRIGVASGVHEPELFLCIDVDDAAHEANVRQASGIDRDWLPPELIKDREELFFNPTRKQVEARRRQYWADLMLKEQTAAVTDTEQCRELLFTEARKQLHKVLPSEKSAFHSRLTRITCLRMWAPELELPECNDAFLAGLLHDLCPHKRSFAELSSAPWLEWLHSRLTPDQNVALDRECPEKIEVPSGRQIQIEYTAGKPPVLAVRIQEVFSWTDTPRIAFGRVPLLLHLLAPNFRPQQVTDDLASFWANTYAVVRKELRRRYPKHSWPEDPLTAKPECKGGGKR